MNRLHCRKRAGFTLVELMVVITIIILLVAVLLPAVQLAREASRATSCANNLRQLALAATAYHQSHNVLPTSIRPPGLTPLPRIAGLTLLLPFLEQRGRYDAYDQTKNWSDPVNLPVTSNQLPIFLCPTSPVDRLDGVPEANPWTPLVATTDYSPPIGVDPRLGPTSIPGGQLDLVDAETISVNSSGLPNSGLIRKNERSRLTDALDGLTHTIMYAESAGRPFLYRKGKLVGSDLTANRVNAGGWSRPASDFSIDGSSLDGATTPGPCGINCTNGDQAANVGFPLPYYGSEGNAEVYAFHPAGAYFVFGDTSVHFIASTLGIRELARLVARADGLPSPEQ